MLRSLFTLLICLFASLALAQGKVTGGKTSCFQLDPVTQPDTVVAACSILIDSSGLDPLQELDALMARGIAYRALDDFESSEADLLAVIESAPDSTPALRMLAWTYRERGRAEEAEAIYSRVVDIDPHWQGWLSRCAVRVDLRRYEDAIEDCAEAERQWQSDRENFPLVPYDFSYFTAMSLNYLERYDEAYETAIAVADGKDLSGRLYHQAAVALWNSGRQLDAMNIALEGIRLYPNDPDIMDFMSQAGILP